MARLARPPQRMFEELSLILVGLKNVFVGVRVCKGHFIWSDANGRSVFLVETLDVVDDGAFDERVDEWEA
jgi:hypothetical protein